MSGEGLAVDFRHAIDEKVSMLSKGVAKGNCKTFEDYKAKCATIAGLNSAKSIFNDVVKTYYTESEEVHESSSS